MIRIAGRAGFEHIAAESFDDGSEIVRPPTVAAGKTHEPAPLVPVAFLRVLPIVSEPVVTTRLGGETVGPLRSHFGGSN